MQPEPVIAGLIATHHTRRRAELLGRPPADPFDQRQQFGVISPCDPMAGNPVPIRAVQRHQPALLTQFDRNENRATMEGGGRVYGRCLHLTLRWFECGNPNLPERPRSPPHGIYEYNHATRLWFSAAYSGSTSQITRLRPARLAAYRQA